MSALKKKKNKKKKGLYCKWVGFYTTAGISPGPLGMQSIKSAVEQSFCSGVPTYLGLFRSDPMEGSHRV